MDATLIFNPAAGQRPMRAALHKAVGRLAEAGWTVHWRETTPTISALHLAREAVAAGSGTVIAAGGDGTINEVINGIVGSGVRLGVLPVGTANIWAVETKIASAPPLLAQNLDYATDVLLDGVTLNIDLGMAGGRYFLLMAGIGFDALVTRLVEPSIKRRVGGFAYAWTALREVWNFRGVRALIEVDDQTIRRRVLLVTISNSKLYAGVPLAPTASLTDGFFDINIFAGRGWQALARHTLFVLLGQHPRAPEVITLRGRRVRIAGQNPLPVQVDAEPIGTTPMTFTVAPQILPAIVSRQVLSSLTQSRRSAS